MAQESFFEQLIAGTNNNLATIAIFSHNPGITGFANTLTYTLRTDNIPTCGIFAVESAIDEWAGFAAAKKDLLFYDYPKLHV